MVLQDKIHYYIKLYLLLFEVDMEAMDSDYV